MERNLHQSAVPLRAALAFQICRINLFASAFDKDKQLICYLQESRLFSMSYPKLDFHSTMSTVLLIAIVTSIEHSNVITEITFSSTLNLPNLSIDNL